MVSDDRLAVLICLLLVICCSSCVRCVVPLEVSLPGCPSKCGNLPIPYPFGIGTSCAREGFQLTCNHSFTPPRTFIDTSTVEVLNISLLGAQARVGYRRAYDCYAKSGSDNRYNIPQAWAGDIMPYTFSNVHNKFTVLGCDTYAYMYGYKSTGIRAGCDAKCSRWEQVVSGSCSSLGCCQVSIPKGLKYFQIQVNSWNNHTNVWDFNPCGYAFLVDQDWFNFSSADITNNSIYRNTTKVPLVLDWVAGNESCAVARKNQDRYACRSNNSVCYDSTSSATGYLCNCSSGYEGNPYLDGGCQDVNECQRLDAYPCKGICANTEGGYTCTCPKGSHGDPKTYGCIKDKKILNIILAVTLPSIFGTILITCIYGHFERKKRFEHAQNLFQQNGGSILEQHMSTHGHIRSIFKVFTKEELEKATNKFDDGKLLGQGGQGMVYEGTLPDNTKVAIKMSVILKEATKRSVILKEAQVNDFINEIIILSQVIHRNVVRLLGCCLEVEIPWLVYEFVPNNTLFYHLQSKRLSWAVRLRIAAEIADALAHLHTKVVVPIYHQDIKTTNILLDVDYRAKVSDFGASKLVPADKEELNTLVKFTFGYLDPEYWETHQLTDKSDVYSFGVVLVELLTGREPLCNQRSEEERCLAKHFKRSMEHNNLIGILDPEMLTVATSTIITQMKDVAKLADRCLNYKGTERPDMMEVSFELEGMWRSGNYRSVEAQAVDETEYLLSEHGRNGQDRHQSVYFSTGDNDQTVAAFAIDIAR